MTHLNATRGSHSLSHLPLRRPIGARAPHVPRGSRSGTRNHIERGRRGRYPDRPDTWEGTHVTETTATTPPTGSETAPAAGAGARRRASGLSGMLLPELKQMAGGLGIKGVGGMRKSQLVDAIKAAQGGGQQHTAAASAGTAVAQDRQTAPAAREDRVQQDRVQQDRTERSEARTDGERPQVENRADRHENRTERNDSR